MKENTKVALSIIIAGTIIALSIYFGIVNSSKQAQIPNQQNQESQEQELAKALKNLKKPNKSDHVKGDLAKAEVVLVEYSDFECPFCKKFHNTMNQIINEYGDKVAWVYRQFPLELLHPKYAKKAAIASECAAKLGGNDAFWKFTDKYFELTPANERGNFEEIVKGAAEAAGISYDDINSCISNPGKIEKLVEEDVKNAIATGGNGTPWSIVITKKGEYIPVGGAYPYEELKKIIDYALEN